VVELRGKRVATITERLASLAMSEAERFADNRIDAVSILRDLTEQDLKDWCSGRASPQNAARDC
jgi:hypothetical protein